MKSKSSTNSSKTRKRSQFNQQINPLINKNLGVSKKTNKKVYFDLDKSSFEKLKDAISIVNKVEYDENINLSSQRDDIIEEDDIEEDKNDICNINISDYESNSYENMTVFNHEIKNLIEGFKLSSSFRSSQNEDCQVDLKKGIEIKKEMDEKKKNFRKGRFFCCF